MIALTDHQAHAKGPNTWLVNTWGVSNDPKAPNYLAPGTYSNGMTIEDDGDPSKFSISFKYPKACPSGVWGFPARQFGAGMGCKPQTPWPARQVKNMGGVVQHFDLTVERKSGDFNILAETFAVASPTDETKGSLEIGFQLWPNPSLSAYAFTKDKRFKGTGKGYFTDADGVRWLAQWMLPPKDGAPRYLMFIPDKAVLSGTLHIGDALAFLRKAKLLTGEEWIRGWWFGVEPVSGEATVRVERLSGLA